MANWLDRATSLFQNLTPPPEPFEVVCDCGGKVTGPRTTAYQKPNCPSCGQPVFVLPLNVYPVTKSRRKAKKTEAKAGDKSKSPNAVVEDKSDTLEISPAPGSLGERTKSTKSSDSPPVTEQALFIVRNRKPFFTPLKKILTAIFVLSVLTVSGLWYRYRLEHARAIVSRAAEAGFAALREKDFATAARELERARSAVDIIGRTDDVAQDIRRSSREATAIARLATGSLAEFLQSMIGTTKRSESFKLSHVDRAAWIIFDADMIPSETKAGRFVVDAPIQLEEIVVKVEIDTPLFKRLPVDDESISSRRVIFAAQLDSLSPSIDDSSGFVLTLNGSTVFLWSNLNTYTAIGYLAFDEESEQRTQAVLQRQLEIPF